MKRNRPAAPEAAPFVIPTMVANGLIGLSLLLVAAALIMLLVSINTAISLWITYQWEPVVRGIAALVLLALGVGALWMVVLRRQ